ncbi:uncharacterized protein ACNLHF_002678 isoform 1-T2 [Anomaloglossus baeobatrachus]|uniref:uncharacterized protein LOC142256055 n=1 Tax=Anomaloglossus baeobatrachus TaxID=238106 RepID=UPI003F508E37
MDEILKSEIFVVVYGKEEGVSFAEFGGLFRQVHGYYLKLSNYGFTSMRALLNDMNDLVEVKNINGQQIIRCKSPSEHHVVVSGVNTLPEEKEQISGGSAGPSSGPPSGPTVKKMDQVQPKLPIQQNPVMMSTKPPVQQKQVKVNSANLDTGKKSNEALKSQYSQPDKNAIPAVKHTNSPQPRLSSTEKTAKITKTPKKNGFPAPQKPLTSKLVPSTPAVKVTTATKAANTTVSNPKQKNNFTFVNPKSRPNFQNVNPGKPNLAATGQNKSGLVLKPGTSKSSLITATGQNKKVGLLPTPSTSKGSPFYINHVPHVVQPGIQPNISYASVCKSNLNMNPFHHSGQQFPPNNPRFIVDSRVNSANVPQSSRAEHRPSIQPSAIIKENIERLLNQHHNGLSIFQLQKLYLIKFHQQLKFRGSTTLKQLLVDLKDVVKTEGIGVQMLVYPVLAKKNPSILANGNQDPALQVAVSLLPKKDLQAAVSSNKLSADSLKSQNAELQEAAHFPLNDDAILFSGPSTINGPSQNPSQESSLPQIILHSSGFSFLMEQQIPDLHNKGKGRESAKSPDCRNEQKTPYHNNMLNGGELLKLIQPSANERTLPDIKPHESLVPKVQNTERIGSPLPTTTAPCHPLNKHISLQSHNTMPVIGTHGQVVSTALQTNVQSANVLDISEYPALPTRIHFKPKSVLAPIEEPPSKPKSNSQSREQIEQVVPSNGKDVQTVTIIEKTSQDEAKISPLTKDSTKTDDQSMPGTDQVLLMSSSVDEKADIHPSEQEQSKTTLQTQECGDFSVPERVAETWTLSSKPKQELVNLQNLPMLEEVCVEERELENHWEMTEQDNTWQTSEKQVCCIL